jgi:hypothetical protein
MTRTIDLTKTHWGVTILLSVHVEIDDGDPSGMETLNILSVDAEQTMVVNGKVLREKHENIKLSRDEREELIQACWNEIDAMAGAEVEV